MSDSPSSSTKLSEADATSEQVLMLTPPGEDVSVSLDHDEKLSSIAITTPPTHDHPPPAYDFEVHPDSSALAVYRKPVDQATAESDTMGLYRQLCQLWVLFLRNPYDDINIALPSSNAMSNQPSDFALVYFDIKLGIAIWGIWMAFCWVAEFMARTLNQQWTSRC